MIKIEKKEDCCGCTACANICPKQAITMKPDPEGFLYPVVNEENCINCGVCDATWAGIIMRCVSAMVTPILLALSLARIPAAALICSSIVWWLV